jgi:hypothetical protein
MNQENSLSLSHLYLETKSRKDINLQSRDAHQKCWCYGGMGRLYCVCSCQTCTRAPLEWYCGSMYSRRSTARLGFLALHFVSSLPSIPCPGTGTGKMVWRRDWWLDSLLRPSHCRVSEGPELRPPRRLMNTENHRHDRMHVGSENGSVELHRPAAVLLDPTRSTRDVSAVCL